MSRQIIVLLVEFFMAVSAQKTPKDCTPEGFPHLQCSYTDCNIGGVDLRTLPVYNSNASTFHPGAPRALNVGSFLDFFAGKYSKWIWRLNVTWQPPDEGSIADIKGFFIEAVHLDYDNVGKSFCKIFNLTEAKFLAQDLSNKPTFKWISSFIRCNAILQISIASLPKPYSPANFPGYVGKTVAPPTEKLGCINYTSTAPNDWATKYIHVNSSVPGIINVTFGLAPPQYSFYVYQVSIRNATHNVIVINETFLNLASVYVPSGPDTSNLKASDKGHVQFHNIPPGQYIVWVQPYQHFSDATDQSKCVCKDWDQVCQIHCRISQSHPFEVISGVSTADVLSTRPAHSESSTAETTDMPTTVASRMMTTVEKGGLGSGVKVSASHRNGEQTDGGVIAAVVVGSTVGILLVMAGAYLVYFRYKKGGRWPMPRGLQAQMINGAVNQTDHQQETFNNVCNENVARDIFGRNPKKVLALYTHDSDIHFNVVSQFAAFLQHEFQCIVNLDKWKVGDIRRMGKHIWVERAFDEIVRENGKVIIICSEGAFTANNTMLTDHSSTSFDSGVFMSGLMMVKNHMAHANNFAICAQVQFQYVNDQYRVPNIQNSFVLMQDIQDLFLFIHDLPKVESGRLTSTDLINCQDFTKTEQGKKLHDVLQKAVHQQSCNGIAHENKRKTKSQTSANKTSSGLIPPVLQVDDRSETFSSHVRHINSMHETNFDSGVCCHVDNSPKWIAPKELEEISHTFTDRIQDINRENESDFDTMVGTDDMFPGAGGYENVPNWLPPKDPEEISCTFTNRIKDINKATEADFDTLMEEGDTTFPGKDQILEETVSLGGIEI